MTESGERIYAGLPSYDENREYFAKNFIKNLQRGLKKSTYREYIYRKEEKNHLRRTK